MLLQPIGERTFYIPGANNLGIIATGDGGAIAIDTGIDKDTGRLIRRALDEARLALRAIIATHHHADHIGGNEFLLRNLPDVELIAPPLEAALIEHPLLEPIYLSMGARPLPALQSKWLMARGAPVGRTIDGAALQVAGLTLEVIPLAGHSLNQVGLAYEGVCFAADGYFGAGVLAKHGVPYAQDVAGQLAALDTLAGRGDAHFLPGHGELAPRAALAEQLAANRAAIAQTSAAVRAALGQPGTLEQVAARVARALGRSFGGLPQYAIYLSAISAHLVYLAAQGQARAALEDDGMVWSAEPGAATALPAGER